jgi:hypothetical protein
MSHTRFSFIAKTWNFTQKWSTDCDFFFPLQILSNVVSSWFPLLPKQKKREREQGKLICLDSSFYLKPAILPPTMINLCFPQDNNVGHFSGLLLTLT